MAKYGKSEFFSSRFDWKLCHFVATSTKRKIIWSASWKDAKKLNNEIWALVNIGINFSVKENEVVEHFSVVHNASFYVLRWFFEKFFVTLFSVIKISLQKAFIFQSLSLRQCSNGLSLYWTQKILLRK